MFIGLCNDGNYDKNIKNGTNNKNASIELNKIDSTSPLCIKNKVYTQSMVVRSNNV